MPLAFAGWIVARVVAYAAMTAAAAAPPQAESQWKALLAGVAYATMPIDPARGNNAGILHVVRIDPQQARLRLAMASEDEGRARTAADWCRARDFAIAINMGMYATDGRSNVGYARRGTHVNNGGWHAKYRSVLVLEPRRGDVASAALLDIDPVKRPQTLQEYGSIVQNLRLIASPGVNVWSKQERRWSEAAVATDRQGRILFLFSRSPYSMWDFNSLLLALPLGIVRAMHVEGGPEASLSIHAGGVDLDLEGSYETGFEEDDLSTLQRPIPNVIGVERAPRP